MFGRDVGGLRRTRQRTGHNQFRIGLDALQEFRDLVHFLLAALGQRPLIVGFFPIRPIGLTMSKKINLHVDLPSLLLLFSLPFTEISTSVGASADRSAKAARRR